MKRNSAVLITSFCLLWVFSSAQCMYAGEGTRPSATLAKGVDLSGKVSDDGKIFTADDDNTWRISNTELVKGLERRFVVLRCRMDVSKRTIHVIGVIDPPENMHMAHLGDAAFRR